MRYIYVLSAATMLLLSAATTRAQQGVAVSATSTTPHPSAMLDVQSTDKGMLIPRMNAAQRTNIPAPATGLLVYDTDSNAFFFRSSTAWTKIASGATGDNLGNHIATQNINLDGKLLTGNATPYGLYMGDNGLAVDSGVYASGTDLTISGGGTRMMWYPKKAAFRAGKVDSSQWNNANIGIYSVAMGQNVRASGSTAVAFGSSNTSTGAGAFTAGYLNTASGQNATVFGQQSSASGMASFATGGVSSASGEGSFAAGVYASAGGARSVAMGDNVSANGRSSVAMGSVTTASGNHSVAIGRNATANQPGSMVLGDTSTTVATSDAANQLKTRFKGGYKFFADEAQTAGVQIVPTTGVAKYLANVAASYDARSLVDKNYVDSSNLVTGGADNLGNHIATQNVQLANKWLSNDGGNEGIRVDSSGNVGVGTATPGARLHVSGSALIGSSNVVSGGSSMVAGVLDTASGFASFAAGRDNAASGNHSAAFGWNNRAPGSSEFTAGEFATQYTPTGTGTDRLFTIGNGGGISARSDAFTILKNGRVGVGNNAPADKLDVVGNIKASDTVKTSKFRMTAGATAGHVLASDAVGNAAWTNPASLPGDNLGNHTATQALKLANNWLSNDGGAEGIRVDSSGRVGVGTAAPTATLDVAGTFTSGSGNVATGASSAATGTLNTASGVNAVAMGQQNTASGYAAVALGISSSASGDAAFGAGRQVSAGGDKGVALGHFAAASGANSVAIGQSVHANHTGSMALGDTVAAGTLTTDTANQLKARFKGGYKFGVDNAATKGIQIVPATGVAKYFSNVAASYDARSLVDRNYVDSSIVAAGTVAIETDPQVSSTTTNKVPRWNGTTLTDGAIYDDGSVIGVNTTSPVSASKLTVAGSASFTGADGNFGVGGNRGFVDYVSGMLRIGTLQGGGATATNGIQFVCNGAERMRMLTNGNVGIGTTGTPGAKLDVAGNFRLGTTGSVLTSVIKTNYSVGQVLIPAGAGIDFIFTVNGAAPGGTVSVSPNADMPNGLIIASARVPYADAVTFRVFNASTFNYVLTVTAFHVTVIN